MVLNLLYIFITSAISAEKFEITSPRNGVLLGAGHIDIKWTSISNVQNYKIYINNILVDTTSSNTYDYYTTKVQKFTVFVEADLSGNAKQIRTNEVHFYVTKKGLAVNERMGENINPLSMNIGWYYTWSISSPFAYKGMKYDYIEYVPMIWGNNNEDENLDSVKQGNFMYLLGYNEPDLGDQSNIPYETAVSSWPKFKGKSRYLGSPVPAFSPTWNNGQWLNNFMNAVSSESVDFVTLHCYYGNYAGKSAAETFVNDVVKGTYELFHKPIWITEFATSGWGFSNEEKRKEVEEYLQECIKLLNELEYVERFAWFSFNTDDENNGASALWTQSTGELTNLGKIYTSYGNPEGYDFNKNEGPIMSINSYIREESPFEDSVTIGDKKYQNLVRKSGVKASASSSRPDANVGGKPEQQSITILIQDGSRNGKMDSS